MEAERTERDLELYRIQSRLVKVERASQCVHRGWELISAGLASLNSHINTEAHPHISDAELQSRVSSNAEHLRPSSRISIDPDALPSGVTRSVARPPEALLEDVVEEQENEQGEVTRIAEDQTKDDDCDSEAEQDEDDISFTVDEDTIKMESNLRQENIGTSVHGRTLGEKVTEPEAIRDSSEKVCTMSTPSTRDSGHWHHLQRMKSIDSLSSFGDDEEIQLSDDDDDQPQLKGEKGDPTNKSDEQNRFHEPRKTSSRKRKGLSSPESRRSVSDTTPPLSEGEGQSSQSGTDSPSAHKPSRRASMRDRKSINYALPKLNTKMRKPDPVDLVPVKKDGRRPSSASRHDGEIAFDSEDEGDSRHTPRLKGRSGVASTGNLREIRKQHQQQSDRDTPTSSPEPNRTPREERPDSPGRRAKRKSEHGVKEHEVDPQKDHSLSEEAEQGSLKALSSEDLHENARPAIQETGNADTISETSTTTSQALSAHDVLNSSLKSVTSTLPTIGTPIPKSGNRLNGQTNIRALSVAGRSKNVSSRLPSQAKVGPKTDTKPKVLSNSSRINTIRTHSLTKPSTTSTDSQPKQVHHNMSGNDAKRNTLHAAMTSNEGHHARNSNIFK